MKRFWLAAALLASIFLGSTVNAQQINHLVAQMGSSLNQAQALAHLGQWSQASLYTKQAEQAWYSARFYREICLSHGHTDDVSPELARLSASLSQKELAEFCMVSSELICRLQQISNTEQLTLSNIL